MGSYSHLTIGEIVFSWKYHVPTFLTFVFKEDDVFIERQIPGDPEDNPEIVAQADPDEPEYFPRAGYRTTVSSAKAVLDEPA